MHSILGIFLIFCSVVLSGQIPSFELAPGTDKTTITFKEVNNLILLPVHINGSDTLYFILDSGAQHLILFGSETDQVQMTDSTLRKVHIAGLGPEDKIEAFVSSNNQIRLGHMTGSGQNIIYIKDESVRFSDLLGHPVHGILGVSIFHHFVIDIEFFSTQVHFYDRKAYAPRKRYTALKTEIRNKRPFLEVSLQIAEDLHLITTLLVDLGESKPISLFLESDEKMLLPEPNYAANLGKGLNGVVVGKVARIESVSIENFEMKKVIASFPDMSSLRFVSTSNKRNGSIGSGLLNRFRVVFDLADSTIYMKKAGILRQPFSYDRTGLIINAEGENYDIFRISGVINESPGYRAGLQNGDIIKSINQVDVDNMKFGEMLNLIEEAGRKIYIEIERNGERIEKRMKIFRLL